MAEKFDVIVIGGGPAGMEAASRAHDNHAKVAVVERARLGGVSTNDGCVPVRALAHAARLAREANQFGLYGLEAEKPKVNFQKVLARVRDVIDEIHNRKDLAGSLEKAGVKVYRGVGDASFVSENTIALSDGTQLEADKFILCTGGHGRRLKFPGSEYACTHSDVWSLEALPQRVVITGTGATGCQLASVLNAFGCTVYLFERSSKILKTEDELVREVVGEEFEKSGINIIYGYKSVNRLEKQADGSFKFFYEKDGAEEHVDCDAAITAAGWPGNVAELSLDKVGVEVTKRDFVQTNDYLQTTNPKIYAAGDVCGRGGLVSGAIRQARVAADNAVLGNKRKYEPKITPVGSFTNPEYAKVGLTEAEAIARKEKLGEEEGDYITAAVFFRDFIRSTIDGRTAGFCKLIADVETRKIIGAHVVGERAVETVNLIAAGMSNGLRIEQLAELELAYPTYVAIVGLTARELGRVLGRKLGLEMSIDDIQGQHQLTSLD